MQYSPTRSLPAAVIAGAMLLGIAGCGDRQSPAPEAAAPVAGQQPEAAPPAETPTEAAAAAEAETAMDERAAQLASREEELAARERELAEREAAAAAKAAQPARTAATPKPVAKEQPKAPAPVEAAPPPPPVTVAAGTPVSVKLSSSYSTKTTTVGQTVNAELASDLVVDGRHVARAGAPISGTVTEVTSGSKKIGAVPALQIDFTQLVVADGSAMPVAVRINQKGQSEKGRDTAKIVGGAAAGAIIGHQIDHDKGKVIGGILGGAAGAVGAHKTGTEVELPAGTVLNATVRSEFVYQGR